MAKGAKRVSDDARSSEVAPNAGVLGEGVAAVYLPVDAPRPHPKNTRLHGQEVLRLARTIVRTTWGAPLIVQRSTLRIIGGHGRQLAAQEILAGIEVDGVLRGGHEHYFDRDAPGPGLIPVRLLDVSDAEADAMALADNADALQGRDDAALIVEMAAGFGRESAMMADMGFDGAALDRLVQSAGDAVLAAGGGSDGNEGRHEIIGDAPQGEDPGADELPPDAPVVSRAGEVYELGPHRLVCGDSRDAATWARLMGGAKANVVFTSPPYASQRKYDESSGFKPIPPDEYVAWWEPLQACVREHLAGDGSFFVNIKEHCDDGQRHLYVKDLTIAHVRAWGWRFVDELCWCKTPYPGDFDGRFKNGFEPVFHFARAPVKWRVENVEMESSGSMGVTWAPLDKTQGMGLASSGTAFSMARPSNVLRLSGTDALGHSAAFPVGLPEFFIKAFSDAGDVIVDPFLGSGSTLIASAKNARVCRGFEISPRYCDVIRRRWTKFARSAGVDPGPGALDG